METNDPPKKLYRSRKERMIAGVCGGLAEYFNIDPTMMRVIFVVLSVVPGAIMGGIIVYLILWIIVPEGPESSPTTAAAEPAAA